jgi:hypothetical protein
LKKIDIKLKKLCKVEVNGGGWVERAVKKNSVNGSRGDRKGGTSTYTANYSAKPGRAPRLTV